MIFRGCMSLAYENVAFGELIHGGGGRALYNPDPNFSPSVAFPRSTQKSFFILIGLCPRLKTTLKCKCPLHVTQWRLVKSVA